VRAHMRMCIIIYIYIKYKVALLYQKNVL